MLMLVVAVLAATPQAPIKLAAPGLSGVNVTPELKNFVSDHLNQKLVLAGLEVLPASQVAAVLGLERQRQLLGCAENECVSELAGALGVDGLVLGSIAKLGDALQLDVRVAAARDARNLALFSVAIAGEAGIPAAVAKAAESLSAQLAVAFGREVKAVKQETETRWSTTRKVGMGLTLGGPVVAIVGFYLVLAAPTPTAAQPEPPGYWAFSGTGMGLLVGGSICTLVGAGLWIFGPNVEVPLTVAFWPSADGGALLLGGRF